MNRREPQLVAPGKTDFLAGGMELTAIVSAALPGLTDHHPRQSVFSRQKEQASSRLQDAGQLAKPRAGVGKMFDHPAAGDAIERIIGERELRQVPGDITGALAVQSRPGAPQHAMRQIEGHQPRFGASALQQVTEDLPRPGADIEYRPTVGHVELSAPEHPPYERLVERNNARHDQHSPRRTVVEMTDAIAVLLQRPPLDSAEFNQSAQGGAGNPSIRARSRGLWKHDVRRGKRGKQTGTIIGGLGTGAGVAANPPLRPRWRFNGTSVYQRLKVDRLTTIFTGSRFVKHAVTSSSRSARVPAGSSLSPTKMARMPKIVDIVHADDPRDVIHAVVQTLAEGGLVGMPTETLYAAVALSANAPAGSRLRELLHETEVSDCVLAVKGSLEALDFLPDPGPFVEKSLRRFWPGPVTLSVDAAFADGLTKSLSEEMRQRLLATGGLQLRAPGGDVFAAVSRLLPAPLVMSGELSSRGHAWSSAAALAAACGDRVPLVVDAGACRYGSPTSVVQLTRDRWELLREGVVSRRTLERLAGNLYLFVCTGNTCRSPMAEGLFRKLLAERFGCAEDDLVDRGYFVASAGVSAGAGAPPSPEAVEVLAARGIDLRSHESQPVTLQLLSQADRIFTMTRGHRDVLLREFPEVAPRVSLLARDGTDVSDPIGAPLDEYRRCAQQIEQHLRTVLDELPSN